MNKLQRGFTLIELMIVVAIVGVLAAIALPAYQNYIKKASYSEVTVGMASAKTAIEACYVVQKDLAKCDTGAEIGEALPSGLTSKALNTVSIATNTAAITAIPNTFRGIKGVGTTTPETCVLTPTEELVDGTVLRLIWTYSGICVDKGYVKA